MIPGAEGPQDGHPTRRAQQQKKLKRAEARIKYLEAENEFLKSSKHAKGRRSIRDETKTV